MFSGAVVIEPIPAAEATGEREQAWMALLAELRSVWKRRTALEAREVELLVEAEETQLYRWLGHANIYAFIETELGYSHHVATERVRVGHELQELQELRGLRHAGELPWSSVRELTRVVTPETEQVWIDAIEGKRADEVQQLVRGKAKGALPTDPTDTTKIRHRIVLVDVSEEALMLYRQARIAVAKDQAGTCTDDDVVRALARAVLEPPAPGDRPSGPRFMTAVTTCRSCKASAIVGAGMEVPLGAAQAARIACDHVSAGDVETSALTRPWARSRRRCGARSGSAIRGSVSCLAVGRAGSSRCTTSWHASTAARTRSGTSR